MRIVVTGATGFIGQALCARLAGGEDDVTAVVRSEHAGLAKLRGVRQTVRDLAEPAFVDGLLDGADAVVHLAGLAHRQRFSAAELQRINVKASASLAREAARTGARFVYLSSAKVLGEATNEKPFSENSPLDPGDAYARSKAAAEAAIQSIPGLQWVILRPPLVYGPGVKANFLSLMRAVDRGIPLPLAGIDNRRSLVYLGNLVDAICACLTHSAAPGRAFLVSDGEDLSSAELARRIAKALGRRPRLWSVPPPLLRLAGTLTGRADAVARLAGSLSVDASALRETLGWNPPFSVQQGLDETARWYQRSR